MATGFSSDISRMIVAGQKEIFTKNFDAYPLEYPEFTTEKKATKKSETYDSMGNLPAASEKTEGGNISYGKVSQAYQTTITNTVYANGYSITLESVLYDLYGVIKDIRAKELARTMREKEEGRAATRVDNAFATNLSDGAPLCTNSRPLLNVAGTYNDTLTTGALTPDNMKTAISMFSQFKNHQGGPMRARPSDGLTNAYNMQTVDEIMGSSLKAFELSNTKNTLPKITWHYSTYMSSTSAWLLWDRVYEHILFQWFLKTQFDKDEDKINTKSLYLNALAIYETGVVPNIGIIGSTG